MTVQSEENQILVSGRLGLMEFHRIHAAIYSLTEKRGYQDVVISFEGCTHAFNGPMLSLCTSVGALRHKGIDFDLRLPLKKDLANRFRNSNWAYLLDPAANEESTFLSSSNLPALNFETPEQQQTAVNRLVDCILGSVAGLAREDLAAIEWALSEITDNVLTHSQSRVGGVVQLSNSRTKKRIEFAVSDAGLGVPKTLRDAHHEIQSDSEALDRAIREGVTRGVGQGNGLFGTWEITRKSEGFFHVHSGYARLDSDKAVSIKAEQIPCVGTLVVACIDRSKPDVLKNALRFGGTIHTPIDYVETKYEAEQGTALVFEMHNEAASFATRVAGTPVRTKLENLISMNPRSRIVIDLTGTPFCSSSFADEVFGKLLLAHGPLGFMQRFEIRGASETVRGLIDRAILQRSVQES